MAPMAKVRCATVLVLAVAVFWTTGGAANLLFLAALAIGLDGLRRVRGLEVDIPWPRSRALGAAIPAAIALAASARTLALPFFSDDYWLWRHFTAMSSPLEALAPPENAAGYRPVAWLVLWALAKLSPDGAALPHAACVMLLTVNAALVGPALRRCGVRRGTAGAAAVLFAAGPVATETAAWVSNVYSLLGGAFALSSLVLLPYRRLTITRALPSAAMLLLGLLSKEDTFLWPFVVGAAAVRFRPRAWRQGLRWTLYFLAVLAAALALRAAFFGALTIYRDALTGTPRIARVATAARAALTTDFPSNAFVTARRYGGEGFPWLAGAAAAFPLACLSLAVGARAGRQRPVRALALVGAGIVPPLALLPVNPSLEGIRHLYIPSFGLSLLLASWLAGASKSRGVRLALLAAAAAFSVGVEQWNFRAWSESAECMRQAQASAAPLSEHLSRGEKVLTLGLPMTVDGVPCFGAHDGLALTHAMRRPDLKTFDSTHGIGHFDDLIEFDRSTRSVLFGFDLTHAITLPRGDSVKLDFTRPDDARRCQFFGVESEVLSGGTRAARWSSQGTPCFVALPPLRVNAGIDLRFAVDGEAIDAFGRAVPIPVVAMARSGAFFMRFVVQDAVTVPRDVQGLRLDIIPLIDSYTVVRSITIRAE